MNKIFIFLVIVGMLFINSTVGAYAAWIIAGICIIALAVLFIFMAKEGKFYSPKVLLQKEEEPEIIVIESENEGKSDE
jgi:hypothetical protein